MIATPNSHLVLHKKKTIKTTLRKVENLLNLLLVKLFICLIKIINLGAINDPLGWNGLK